MFSKVHKAGGQRAWRHVLMLVAVVCFAMSAVTEPFAATAKKPSGSWNSTSFVTTGDHEPVSRISVELDCANANISGHSASSHCMATLSRDSASGASIERLGFVCSGEASWKTVDKKPPHGPPKPISLS